MASAKKIDPSTLPSFQDAIRRIAFEIMGYEPQDVVVDDSGSTVTITDFDGEVITTTAWEFLRDAGQMIKDATDEG